MAKVYTTGLAQKFDTNYLTGLTIQQNNQNIAKAEKKIAETAKQKNDFLSKLDQSLTGIKYKRGEELRQKKDQYMAESLDLLRSEGVNNRTLAQVKRKAEELEHSIAMAAEQQEFLASTRKAAENKQNVDQEATIAQWDKAMHMGIEEFNQFTEPIVKYKGDAVQDMMVDYVRQIPKNKDLTDEELRRSMDQWLTTDAADKLFEEGLAVRDEEGRLISGSWDTYDRFKEVMWDQTKFNYNRRVESSNKSAEKTPSYIATMQWKDGGMTQPRNPKVRNYYKEKVYKQGSQQSAPLPQGGEVRFDKSITGSDIKGDRTDLNIEVLVDPSGKTEPRHYPSARFQGYAKRGADYYAIYSVREEKQATNMFDRSSTEQKIVYAKMNADLRNKENSITNGFFDIFVEAAAYSGKTSSEVEELIKYGQQAEE